MKINSTDFVKKYEDCFFNLNEMDLIILRGHLIIEELLYQLIAEYVFHAIFIKKAKLSFSKKVDIARSMSQYQSNNSISSIILAINKLRNNIAHELPSQNIANKLVQLKDLFTIEMKGTELESSWKNHVNIEG